MENINIRFKKLRETCGKTQTEWGEILGIKTSGVSDIENERRKVTEKHLIMLSNWKEYPVDINWLRTGEGEMFLQIPEDDEIASLVYELLDPKGNDFYTIVLATIQAFDRLSPNSQKVVQELCGNIIENLKKKKGD